MPIPNPREIYQNLSGVLRSIKGFNWPPNMQLPRGLIITFHYVAFKHDPNPIVIVTEAWPPGTMRYGKPCPHGLIQGINLNYIVFNYFKRVVLRRCGDPNYGYFAMKNDMFLRLAFRRYKWDLAKNILYFDPGQVKEKSQLVAKFDPNNMKKQDIKEQLIDKPINQLKASEMAQGPIPSQPASQPAINMQQQQPKAGE